MLATGEGAQILMEKFFARIKEETGGRLDITIYPAGALCPGAEILDSVQKGTIEWGYSCPAWYSAFQPATAYSFGIPTFAIDTYDAMFLLYSYGMEDLLNKDMLAKTGGKVICRNHAVQAQLIVSKKPIRGVADFKGLKMRATGAASKWFAKMGASPTWLPGEEIYTALSTGLVETANWGAYFGSYKLKFYEVVDYFIEPMYGTGACNVHLINADAWDSLPEDVQTYLDQAILKEALEINKYMQHDYELEAREVWAEHCTPIFIPLEEQAKMNAIGEEVMEECATDKASIEAYEMIKKYLKERKILWGR